HDRPSVRRDRRVMIYELPIVDSRSDSSEGEVYQWFPANGLEADRRTSWRGHWRFSSGSDGGAARSSSIAAAPVRETWKGFFPTIRNPRLADLWVLGSDEHPRDALVQPNWTSLPASHSALGPACIAPGAILNSSLLKEIHDDQLRWKSFHNTSRR